MKAGDFVKLNDAGKALAAAKTHVRTGRIIREYNPRGNYRGPNTIWVVQWVGRRKPQNKSESFLTIADQPELAL